MRNENAIQGWMSISFIEPRSPRGGRHRGDRNGQFVLFNSLGEMVLQTTLSKEMTKTQLTIKDIANGLYHYEINFADKEKFIGKLSILK